MIPVIINYAAGNIFQNKASYVKRMLGNKDFYYPEAMGKDDTKKIIRDEKARGNNCWGLLSGDGTIGDVINELLPEEGTLIIMPKGNSNNLAKSLEKECKEMYKEHLWHKTGFDINLADYEIDTDLIEIRIGDEKPMFASSTCSFGLTAAVCYEAEKEYKRNVFGNTFRYMRKAARAKKVFELLKIAYSINRGEKQVCLEDIYAIAFVNGHCIAGISNFNKGNLSSDKVGLFFMNKRSAEKFVKVLFNLKVLQNTKHITSERDEQGFNSLGINYMGQIESLNLKIFNVNNNRDYFFELDGEARKFNPDNEIRLKVKPKSIKLVYLPWILKRFGKQTRIYYKEK